MKSLTRLTFILAFVVALPAMKIYAQKPFEGTITWSMTVPMMGDDDKHSMVVNVKGKKSEMEMDMGAMGTIKTYMDQDTKKAYMVVGPKMGFTYNIQNDSATKPADNIDMKPTGKTETIAGYKAEEYLLKGLEGVDNMSIWVTPDFPKDIRQSMRNIGSNPNQDEKQGKAMKQLIDKGLTPVKISASKDGEVAVTMEFVKFEHKSLDDALFVPPTDIKFQPMPKKPAHGMN